MLWLTLVGCTNPRPDLAVQVAPEHLSAIEEFASFVPYEGLSVSTTEAARGVRVRLVADLDCGECWRVRGEGNRFEVHGGGLLGLQYGLAELLEAHGFRFLHPYDTYVPDELARPEGADVLRIPEMERRGLHLHTLHPIEGLYDFWVPGDTQRARRVIDWTVKNRGNYVQWVGLNDVVAPEVHAPWKAHTREILDAAHARGVQTGLGVQLFGSGNLQLAYDLVDAPSTPEADRAAMEARMHLVLDDLPFDDIDLSFGEFFAEEPESFVQSVETAYDVMTGIDPALEVSAVVHVGDDLRVEYQGEETLYYFLVAEADRPIVPRVHTVMFYNLYEDTSGAYHHRDFSEHRRFLLDYLERGERAAYFPESAYWVAFDDSVPVSLPLYVRSRWLDLHELRAEAPATPLPEHVLFSSGWEWGYWLTDAATLRMNAELPDDWRDPIEDLYAPWRDRGVDVGEIVVDLAEAQHLHLVERRLAAYLAGRDALMEFGYTQGIVSQPVRPSFAAVHEDYAAFAAEELGNLRGMREDFAEIHARTLTLDTSDRWVAEVVDGVAITALRAGFVEALFDAVVRDAREGDAGARLADAEEILDEAREIVRRRHERLHDPERDRLLDPGPNPTIYKYGYLRHADELCFWERDLAQARNAIDAAAAPVPPCSL